MPASRDVKWGFNIGLKMALIYAVVGSAVLMIGRESETDVMLLVIGYASSGIISGVMLGLLRQTLNRSRFAAMALGGVIALPPVAIIAAVLTAAEGIPFLWPVVVILSVYFGALGGWYFGPGGPHQRSN